MDSVQEFILHSRLTILATYISGRGKEAEVSITEHTDVCFF